MAPVIRTSHAGLRAGEGGTQRALQLLPAYICRTQAEREIIVEIVKENHLFFCSLSLYLLKS